MLEPVRTLHIQLLCFTEVEHELANSDTTSQSHTASDRVSTRSAVSSLIPVPLHHHCGQMIR